MDIEILVALAFGIGVALGIAGIFYSRYKLKLNLLKQGERNPHTMPLHLTAYERLVVFVERISLQNLLKRLYTPNVPASEMRYTLIKAIQDEFDYNVSQQIYVSPTAWEAIKKLKDENIYIINHVGRDLSEDATSKEFKDKILDFVVSHKLSQLPAVVLDALNYEAKSYMK